MSKGRVTLQRDRIPCLPPEALQGWNRARGRAGTIMDPTFVAAMRWARAVLSTHELRTLGDLYGGKGPTDILSLHGYYPRELAVPFKDLELTAWAHILPQSSRGPLLTREGERWLPTDELSRQLALVGEHRSHIPR